MKTYNLKLIESTDECVGHPLPAANLILEKLVEELNVDQLIRSYKGHYNVSYGIYGFFKLLLFGRVLKRLPLFHKILHITSL